MGSVGACIKQPEYSVVPQIQLGSFLLRQGTGAGLGYDTLIITIKFKDGNGDIGIGAVDLARPDGKYVSPWYWAYDTTNNGNYGYTTDNNPADLNSNGSHYKFIDFRARKIGFSGLTIPITYDCVNWELGKNVGSSKIDTIYITQNPSAYTLNMSLYTRRNVADPFVYYDPGVNDCNPSEFSAAFPDLSNDRKNSPIEGSFTYKFEYLGFAAKFSGQYLKFNITITDRAGNVSNTVEADLVVQ
ncbi:MAG: hypothetical protein JSS93_12060 [Bacteroidetes bacterium]|nr:hypothetical protein [Bacteroidota bacterium]